MIKNGAGGMGSGMDMDVMDVTPAMAKRWLEKNHPSNRTLNWRWIESMANDIRDGNWKLTHQGICFDRDGYLVDGQHRLSAVVMAEKTARMLVVKNSSTSFHDPIDRGRTRSVALILGMRTSAIAALNIIRMFETGIKVHTPMTVAEGEAVFARHQGHLSKALEAGRAKLRSGVLAACAWAMPIDEAMTVDFAEKVATGEMLSKGDPAYALRLWREHNQRVQSWDFAMASLNCLRHHLTMTQLKSVYVGESGYRAFVGRRRAMRVPHTPTTAMVTSVGWSPTMAEKKIGAMSMGPDESESHQTHAGHSPRN